MIRHIARREILVRSRDRSTLVSTFVTIAILAAIILLPSLVRRWLGGDGGDLPIAR